MKLHNFTLVLTRQYENYKSDDGAPFLDLRRVYLLPDLLEIQGCRRRDHVESIQRRIAGV